MCCIQCCHHIVYLGVFIFIICHYDVIYCFTGENIVICTTPLLPSSSLSRDNLRALCILIGSLATIISDLPPYVIKHFSRLNLFYRTIVHKILVFTYKIDILEQILKEHRIETADCDCFLHVTCRQHGGFSATAGEWRICYIWIQHFKGGKYSF